MAAIAIWLHLRMLAAANGNSLVRISCYYIWFHAASFMAPVAIRLVLRLTASAERIGLVFFQSYFYRFASHTKTSFSFFQKCL